MAYPPKAAFYEQYADAAMRQQQMYGIPASITLAQMYIESAGGGSRLAQQGNNYFGIKCPPGWVEGGKPYGLHDDDKPNEKFCYYGSVEESISHHSEFLMGKRYERCQQLDSTDYKGWATGLKACGYASAKNYASELIRDIEAYGLNKYDQMAVVDAQKRGITIGYAKGQSYSSVSATQDAVLTSTGYCFPLEGNMVMSDGFGNDPTSYRKHTHKGIDLAAQRGTPVVSTETGVVVAVKNDMTENDSQAKREANGNTGGNYVIVEYQRANGESYRVSYCHLTDNGVTVQKGQTVSAGTILGYVGSTGNSTGPHLHLTVRKGKDGVYDSPSNPLDYLAEVSVRGNLQNTVMDKGTSQDILASIKPSADTLLPTPGDQQLLASQNQLQNSQVPTDHMSMDDNWLSKMGNMNDPMQMLAFMMGQNGGSNGMGMGFGGDLISTVVGMLFASAMALSARDSGVSSDMAATQSREKEEELSPEEERDAVIMRKRQTVDPERARQLASMNFDSECPEAGESQGVRLA